MVCKDDLLKILTDIENQLEALEEQINVRVKEEKYSLMKERQLQVASADKNFSKAEARILVKMRVYRESALEKPRARNNLELSYKTT